jgi:hypothetical protein
MQRGPFPGAPQGGEVNFKFQCSFKPLRVLKEEAGTDSG